jgi:lysophospholipase L1-like esterase
LPGVSVVNRGIDGDTSEKVLSRLDTILSTKAEIAVLLIGNNDAHRDVPPERTSDNIGRIIAALLAAGMRVIVLSVSDGVPRLRRPVADINKGARAVCRTGCTFVDLPLSGPDGLLFSAYSPDGTHLNAQGYKALAETIRPLL